MACCLLPSCMAQTERWQFVVIGLRMGSASITRETPTLFPF